ncbi:CHASE2 sensor adenylate/guanylate cyclase [Geotalea daltonii FRC-32]|uniref:CHASE2 sensor adenylate/guanylate cyclase n=1 Tax=Geotalea daltonii (strain DSM 22248 / JCM 15807 / FRC-32) TaxID=316067 RepID=B9M2L3_GEODF|nr:adenylate/guanylate cyclase domain-containing protein [Geotalea daltonii]ACM19392.1 CHASE2 sensor adenylate/guanylate cyclase [Geotalea daltonii FRC-32]
MKNPLRQIGSIPAPAWRGLIGMLVTVLMVVLMLRQFYPLELLEMKLFDTGFKLRGAVTSPEAVAIAEIDEKSLQKIGRWPWDRSVMARLVDRLAEANVAVIAFDVIFSEADESDPLFAKAISRAGNVILPIVFDFHGSPAGKPDPLLDTSSYSNIKNRHLLNDFVPPSANRVNLPVPALSHEAMGFGHISMLPDSDGTMRWEPLVVSCGGRYFSPLGLQAAAYFLGVPPESITVRATESVTVGQTVIPTDVWGRTIINYYGPGGSFPHYSISDILDGTVPAKQLENRVILIGATAPGIYDLRVTPMAAAMPGVEKHAAIAASIIDRSFIRKVSGIADLAVLIGSGLLLTLILSRRKIVGAITATAVGMLALFISGYLLFSLKGIWLNLAYPSNNLLFIFIGVTAFNYAFEEQRARKIRAMFSNYVTRTIVNELIDNPEMAKLGGERREVTVLFSDLVGFTTFSEQHSPEEVVAILNEYLGAMTDVILKWQGTLDKFIGDAIVVFWGAPLPAADHAERAIGCAAEMAREMKRLREKWLAEGKTALHAGIGINTGEVLVGNIGALGKKMDYTVIGDQVNLGSRVESLTRHYQVPILITANTVAKLCGREPDVRLSGLSIHGIERVIVKGKEEPVGLYRLEEQPDPSQSLVIEDCPEGAVVRFAEK